MSFRTAFDTLNHQKSRPATILNRDTAATADIRITPTNYQRNLQGPGESVFEGREWIITKTNLDASTFTGSLKRNLRIQDVDLGEMTIREVIEMYDHFGNIIGYRVRTD